jgi:hypothetical protein
MPDSAYELELYKSLRHEAVAYLEKIPAVWLQKFVFAGGVLAFILAKPVEAPAFASRANDVMIAGFLCIPLLAMVLDVKIFEYSLHARAISRFIETQFADLPKIAAWEAALWGGGEREIATLARYRSSATVAVTLVSTAVLIVLAGTVIASLVQHPAWVLTVAWIAAAAYVVIGILLAIVIWPRLGAWRTTS